MTNFKRQIGYCALIAGLISTPAYATENINKAVKSEVNNTVDEQQIDCLAKNIYREAGAESVKGKYAVAHVVMNRVYSKKFPNTPCGVIHQKWKGTCQFSWVCSKKQGPYNNKLLLVSKKIAEEVYLEKSPDVTGGSLYFHATSIKPTWAKRMKMRIGRHIFY